MPDIRSFFGPKGGAPPAKATSKASVKKEDDSAKKGRGKARKIVDDSDEEAPPVETKKPVKSTPAKKKTSEANAIKGVETTASSYFASNKAKPVKSQDTPKSAAKVQPKPEVEICVSPRKKEPASRPAKDTSTKGRNGARQQKTTSYQDHDHDDDDAFIDDEDGGDDIYAADMKGRSKRKNDDYAEEESEEEFLPQPKRVASRSSKAVIKDESDDDVKPAKSKASGKSPASARKRKSPASDEEDEEEVKPRKKAAPAKPRAPRAKKEAEPEPDNIQSIIDNMPTVDAPDAPPPDPNNKFDWRKAAGGNANSGAAPMEGLAEIPQGEDNCLMGKTFVFTGLLKTIGREEAQALVKQYGGKVTTAPSSKTDFVVLGDDAGPSKLRKIKEHGIKTIDEAGLFYLIKTMPAHGGTGKGAEKAKQKQEEEAQKIRAQAAEMEKEEKARRVEAQKAKKAAISRGAASTAPRPPPVQLWTSKYAPTQLNHICGNKAQVERIQNWLRNWAKNKKYNFQKRGADGMGGARAIIISGPPGIGKTTAAHLAAELAGFDAVESNASDSRSKKLVENGISDAINNTSLLGFFAGDGKKVDEAKKQTVLIMDEVDGMSAGDRGGVGALAKFCKKTEVPLILICNDRRLPKMKPFDHIAFDIKFQRPTVDQVRSRIMTICHREGLKLPPPVVNSIIEGCNKDIRQIINMLSTAKLDMETMDFQQSKDMTKAWEKHVILKPWDIVQKLLGGGLFTPASKATLNDKIELYFNDHEFSYLMIQENYLNAKPSAMGNTGGFSGRERNLKHLELIDQAAESISDGDLVDRMIHGPQQQWSLMPTHAVFSTVRPASLVAGQLIGSSFTSWLGNNSKLGKLGRFVREIHSHMRLRSSGDHNEIRQQYLPVLWYQIIKRMEVEGQDCIEDVINLMDNYFLTRDDFDAIKELGVGPQSGDGVNIETQTKAAFTRIYNKMSHPVPFMKASNVIAPKKATKDVPDLEEAIEEEDDADVIEAVEVDEDEELDIKGDKYIKQPKPKAAKVATKKGGKKTATKAAEDDEEDEPKPAKPKAKRGRPAKK